jgi:PAS domain S-box-containing protein
MKTLVSTLRAFFLALDLRGKITAALLLATLTLGSIVTLITYATEYRHVVRYTTSLLEAQARLEQREIELQLKSLLALGESIAGNAVTANALADSQGRETYLAPLLRNQILPVTDAAIHVTDYRGQYVAGQTGTARQLEQHPAFVAVMNTARADAVIEDNRLLIVMPVIYRLTGSVEGSVVLNVPLESLLSVASGTGRHRLTDPAGTLLAGQPPAGDVFEVSLPLSLAQPLDRLGLTLYLSVDRDAALRDLRRLLVALLGMGVFVVVAMVAFARAGARFITAPLGTIAAAAEEIATSGRPVARLPIRGDDEFGRLSVAFNTMVDRLAESYAELEQRVIDRTRELEESQQEAQKASNLLREAVSSIAQGFTIYDENDCLVICNEAYLSFYEESRDLIQPGNRFEDIVRRGAERGQYTLGGRSIDDWVRERVDQHRRASGQVLEQRLGDGRWLLIVEHRTPSGYIVGNRIDITELKQTTEALRQRELYLRATLDNLPFFFWLKDAESRFLAVNTVFAAACGRGTPDRVEGLTDNDVWPAELAERYRKDDFEVMASRHEKSVEEPVAGGSEAGWIETYKKPVIAPDGSILGTVGFARDISDRKLAEARIRDRTEQLNAIFELSPDGFVSFDATHRVKYASPAFQRMTGLTQADIVGLDEAGFAARLNRECKGDTPFPDFVALRAQQNLGAGGTASRQGGHRRTLIEILRAGQRVLEVGIRTAEAESVSQILYFRDVTHETEVDRMKSEFLSTAAHELRTPMASIYGFTELLINQPFGPDEQRDFLETIFRQSELMVSIINELLDLARIEARRGKDFVIEPIVVGELVSEVVAGFRPPAGRAAPLLDQTGGRYAVRADRKKLTQAISNVLSNAYKYSPDGGDVSIGLLAAESVTTDLGIRIRDHGIGMTPQQLVRVCERFYRADTSGRIPGTGLGMSIVKEIVELLDGTIHIASQPGQGTTVTLWLPRATAAGEATANDTP